MKKGKHHRKRNISTKNPKKFKVVVGTRAMTLLTKQRWYGKENKMNSKKAYIEVVLLGLSSWD
jgi:hypothetical protein